MKAVRNQGWDLLLGGDAYFHAVNSTERNVHIRIFVNIKCLNYVRLTLVGLGLSFVNTPPSSTTASSTIPRVPNVLFGSSFPSATVYCAETFVDLASPPVITNTTVNSCDKIIWKQAGLVYKLNHFL